AGRISAPPTPMPTMPIRTVFVGAAATLSLLAFPEEFHPCSWDPPRSAPKGSFSHFTRCAWSDCRLNPAEGKSCDQGTSRVHWYRASIGRGGCCGNGQRGSRDAERPRGVA